MIRTALLLTMLCMTCQQARKTSESSIWADVSEPLRGAVEQAGSNSYLWIELPVEAVECPAGRVCL